MLTMRDVDDLKLQRRATMSLPWLQDILHGCEATLAARQQEAEEERQAPARSLDKQIAAAVQAAMRAQASRHNGHSPQQRTAAAPQPPEADGPASAHDHDPSWCPTHQVTMRWHDGNARGPGWFSHQLADGSYCKGK